MQIRGPTELSGFFPTLHSQIREEILRTIPINGNSGAGGW